MLFQHFIAAPLMDNPRSDSQCIVFNNFEVDLRLGELRRNGRKIRLQPQPFQLLALLLEHPGEVVTREEVRGKLWPDGTHRNPPSGPDLGAG